MNLKERDNIMKFRHLLTGTFFTLCMLAATSMTSFASASRGQFEAVTDSAITGWAYDSSSPDEALNIRITIKNKDTGEEMLSQKLSAGEYRETLFDRGKGNGCHGFTLTVDWTAYPDGTYTIEGCTADKDFVNSRIYTKENGQGSAQAEAVNTQTSDMQEAQETTQASGSQTPQPETTPNLISLGTFKTTGYCPCRACSEGWGRHTCTGAVATSGHTIAVDPRVIPYGSRVMINGVTYTAEDRGGGVKGNHIDIFFDTHSETRQHGTQNAEVYLVIPA